MSDGLQQNIDRALKQNVWDVRLQEIFIPLAREQRATARKRQNLESDTTGLRFAHYTSAEAAVSILRTKRLWMRNALCMADYREIQHGFEITQRYFNQSRTKHFSEAFETEFSSTVVDAMDMFNDLVRTRFSDLDIYISSLSEHRNSEDSNGRLSMWRAFGVGGTRVALILRTPTSPVAANKLGIMFSPVAYLTESAFHGLMERVIRNIHKEREFLRSIDKEILKLNLFVMLLSAVTCLKHEGFREEQEWRAVFTEFMHGSVRMEQSLEVVGGVPQKTLKLPLDETVSSHLKDLDIFKMLDRIIVGPSQYPSVVQRAFVDLLRNAQVKNPESKVQISGIPIRS